MHCSDRATIQSGKLAGCKEQKIFIEKKQSSIHSASPNMDVLKAFVIPPEWMASWHFQLQYAVSPKPPKPCLVSLSETPKETAAHSLL